MIEIKNTNVLKRQYIFDKLETLCNSEITDVFRFGVNEKHGINFYLSEKDVNLTVVVLAKISIERKSVV